MTPAAPRTVQTIVTATTVTMPKATESRNAVFITDHGSTRVSLSRARRGWRPGVRRTRLPRAEAGPALALVALALAGTVLPFWLFAFGQARVPANTAGAFLNLEHVSSATDQLHRDFLTVLGIDPDAS